MAAPKAPVRDWQLTSRKPKPVRNSGKTADQRRPKAKRESVKRAVMRLPLDSDSRKWYVTSLGIGGTALSDLLNRVDGLRLTTTDSHAIAVERINGESLTKVRRRRRRVV